ncbi:MAG: hypothetical protein IJB70_11485 [Clostridia bacterium]|nr:hypothetical protein [Clostridia bacterium]
MNNSNKVRTLNTNAKAKQSYSKFEMPGFRSGSIVKKFFALLYYCYAGFSIIKWIAAFLQGDFSGASDVFGFIIVGLAIIAVFLVPVIAIGVSNYYDWHGIKLFLIIMTAICVLSTVAIFSTNLFSKQYVESVIGPMDAPTVEMTEDSAVDSSSDSAADSSSGSEIEDSDKTEDDSESDLD